MRVLDKSVKKLPSAKTMPSAPPPLLDKNSPTGIGFKKKILNPKLAAKLSLHCLLMHKHNIWFSNKIPLHLTVSNIRF